jgi:hypothetical protein
MALVNCPECNFLVSDTAAQCPECGFPLEKYVANSPRHDASNQDANQTSAPFDASLDRLSTTKVILASIVALCLSFIYVPVVKINSAGATMSFDGYEWLWNISRGRPMISLLLIEIIIIVLVTIGLAYIGRQSR